MFETQMAIRDARLSGALHDGVSEVLPASLERQIRGNEEGALNQIMHPRDYFAERRLFVVLGNARAYQFWDEFW